MNDRPSDLSSRQLRFHRQKPIHWMSTRVLASTASRLALAKLSGAFLDKRELQALNQQGVFDHSDSEELWVDFIADLGDGFDATYSVAYLASQAELDPGEPLPRGDITVFGGDEVYPASDWREYENRTKGPYQAAMPEGDTSLYVIPGDHDWYDGLTAFLRLFGNHRKIGGRQTHQSRSYFAVNLPHRWWLLGIDSAFDAYLDQPQLDYFTWALGEMEPGDPVILAVPEPVWYWADSYPRDFDRMDYFIRNIVECAGGDVRLILTGDRHHYARYRAVDGQRDMVTAGGGGAYLSPTHTLPRRVEAPSPDSLSRHGSESRTYDLQAKYPSRRKSWSFGAGVFWRLPKRNLSFVAMMGVVQLLGLLSFLNSPGTAVAASAAIVAGTVIFANPSGSRTFVDWAAGLAHGAAQIGLMFAGAWAWRTLSPPPGWESYVAYVPISGIVATMVVAAYMLVASSVDVNSNELFAGQSIEHAKGFLRLKVTVDGVTVYPIAVPKVGRKWHADPDGEPEDSWIVPDKPIKTHFAEEPFFVPKGPART